MILFPLSLFSYSYKLVVGAQFKNEAPWLKEWIEFHRLIGVEHFYLYNNDSSDNFEEVLKPYIEAGIVDLIPWHSHSSPWIDPGKEDPRWVGFQLTAYKDCMQRTLGKAKWVAIIDIDEFLVPTEGIDSFQALLDGTTDRVGSLVFYWRCFGTSEIWDVPKGTLMVEKLVRRSEDDFPSNQIVKSIHRPEAVEYCKLHIAYLKRRYISVYIPPEQVHINHYQHRGRKETLLKRCGIRVADEKDLTPENLQAIQGYEENFNRIEDKVIFPYIHALKKAMFND